VDPFAGNTTIGTLYRQAERLAIATHAVSDLVPLHEEARTVLRRESRKLLSHTLALYASSDKTHMRAARTTLACVRHILSLLDILHISGSISDMNTEVLKHAYGMFARRVIQLSDSPATHDVELHDTFFVTTPTEVRDTPTVKDIKDTVTKGHAITDTPVKETVTDSDFIKDTTGKKKAKSKSISERRRLGNRRMHVIDAVAKLGPASVADIAKEIPDCSLKTLQRELAALVRDNVLVREGEKRWTTYSIAP